MEYIIISDLHVGAGTSLDIFHSHDDLSAFLRDIGAAPTRLIINGDFIDFLAVAPFGKFSRAAAIEKVDEIVKATSNKPLWDSFGAFLEANEQNRIEVLLGNHDVELVFKEVQAALKKVMAGPPKEAGQEAGPPEEARQERIRFYTDRLSYPDDELGGVHIHIEHGFQYDPFNWYDRQKLSLATQYSSDGSTFKLPAGSRFVYGVLNGLTTKHPYIPLLKPETAVFWITAAEEGRSFGKLIKGIPGLAKNTLLSKTAAWRRGTMFRARGGRANDPEQEALERQLAEIFLDRKAVNDTDFRDVQEFLKRGRGDEPFAGDDKFALNPLRWGRFHLMRRALGWLKGERESFFDPQRKDAFKRGLKDILDRGAQVAVLGHSHGSKLLRVADPDDPSRSLLYLNTGTWADLLDFDPEILDDGSKLRAWLDTLKKGTYTPKRILTFARLAERKDAPGITASLERWSGGRAETIDSREVGNGNG